MLCLFLIIIITFILLVAAFSVYIQTVIVVHELTIYLENKTTRQTN